MKRALLCSLGLIAAIAAFQAQAQNAIVEGVQMPAWIERNGARQPVLPGMVVQPGDVLHTGPGSRLAVRMAERSLVKLGENGQLRFTEMSTANELFRAALHVFEGAFRFTTELAQKGRRREVRVSVGTVTAGIRGTDFWGRSRDESEVVCLLEGAIEIEAQGEAPVRLDQELQFYQRNKGKAEPLGFIDKPQLEKWARNVELERGAGAARVGGRFQAEAARADNQADALAVYDRLREAGYAAEIQPLKDGEQAVYRVRVRNLASAADAKALESRLRQLSQR